MDVAPAGIVRPAAQELEGAGIDMLALASIPQHWHMIAPLGCFQTTIKI